MNLKTYRAPSMAEALVEVKRDLGRDAVILRTRSFKVGGMLGIGGKQIVEITASAGAAASGPASPRAQRPAQPSPITSSPAPSARPTAPAPTPRPRAPRIDAQGNGPTAFAAPVMPEPRRAPVPAAATAESRPAPAIEAEINELKRLVGQVLHSTRQTQVSVARGTSPSGSLPDALFSLYSSLIDNDVSTEIADEVCSAVRDELSPDELKDGAIVRQTVLRRLEMMIPTRGDEPTPVGRPRVVALVGPTGVGKTTTVAKLAAIAKLREGKRVGLITCDTYRIAAVDQLRTYADIIALPLEVANSPGDIDRALEKLRSCDLVLLDTVGRSQNDKVRLKELRDFIDAASPDETHLVLSSGMSENAATRVADRFSPLSPNRVMLTKTDEALTVGAIAGIARRVGLPFSFVTMGQEVPDHIDRARSDHLARLVLDGPVAAEPVG